MKGGSWGRRLGTAIPGACKLRVDGWQTEETSTGTNTPGHLSAFFRPRLEPSTWPPEGLAWLASHDPEPTLSPPPCVSGAHNTAYPEKCWKLGAAPGGGPVFPVSCRVPCSPVQACAFMSEEPERAPSILTTRAGAGQVRTCKGGVHGLGGWGRCVHVCVYTEPEVGQGDPCPAPSSQAEINSGFGARQPSFSNSWQCDREQILALWQYLLRKRGLGIKLRCYVEAAHPTLDPYQVRGWGSRIRSS